LLDNARTVWISWSVRRGFMGGMGGDSAG
jgi:hypothetical protein